MSDHIHFSFLHLVIGEQSPCINTLKKAFADADDTFEINDTHYIIRKGTVDQKFFWIYAQFGKRLPYSATVFNVDTSQQENNPRTKSQIETDKQALFLYSEECKTLFASSLQKKAFLEDYLKARTEQDVTIKAFFNNVDEFRAKIRTIDKIKFTAKSNLFNSGDAGGIFSIFPDPSDIYGLGKPESFCLEAKFSTVGVTDSFKQKLRSLVGWKNACQAETLVCIGRDDNNLETIFNVDSLIQKISVETPKDDQGMYDPELVRDNLIKKIREQRK